ncbi:peptide ABC transporter substrate-binding protein [Weissella cibaria]|uniref:Solute-binding protein family 5 domain-containing protein n=1 Tax=Weissella cibaria TaxID=137591 RepID=A0A2S1KS69_9LACO|nr:peptide ABC transporter substrate-binding protein [Weissella cibaria]AWF95848.1 hypothetical protein B6254_1445 [Weissella cibaria]
MKKIIKTSVLLSTAVILGSGLTIVAHAATDKTINWTESADLSTLDPSTVQELVSDDAITASGDGLYRNDASGKPQLSLAQSVDKSADGLTYTFKLRNGIKWANGDPITAQDFVYGWQRTVNPKTKSVYAYLYSGIKNADAINKGQDKTLNDLGVKALDDQTLQVTLEKPLPQLTAELTMPEFFPQNQKFEEKVGKKYATTSTDAISAGPFIVKGWNGSSNSYELVKNPNYWDAKSVKTPKITVQTVKDQNTGYNLYKQGKVDFTTLSSDQVRASQKRSDYKVIPTAATRYLELNERRVPAFKNAKVRQAISYAINRDQLANHVLRGTATPATTFTATRLAKVPGTTEDFAKDAQVKGAIAYNEAKAKSLFKAGLQETGTSKLNLQVLTDDSDASKNTAEFLQSQLQKLPGLKISVKEVPAKQRIALTTGSRKFDIAISNWMADYADPSTFLDLYTSDSSFNDGGWSSATFDAAEKAAKTTDVNDDSKRFADYKIAEQTIEKDAGVVPLYYASSATLFRTSVKGVVANTTGAQYDWKWAYKH